MNLELHKSCTFNQGANSESAGDLLAANIKVNRAHATNYCAFVLIADEGCERFLVQKKDLKHFAPSYCHRLSLFGGTGEPGELPEYTVARELAEELDEKLSVPLLRLPMEPLIGGVLPADEIYPEYQAFIFVVRVPDLQFSKMQEILLNSQYVKEGLPYFVNRKELLHLVRSPGSFVGHLDTLLAVSLDEKIGIISGSFPDFGSRIVNPSIGPGEVVMVTGNPGKVVEIIAAVGRQISSLDVELEEIQPSSTGQIMMAAGRYNDAMFEIVRRKAQSAFYLAGKPVLVEDTGLFIDDLEGRPGPLVKTFSTERWLRSWCELTHLPGHSPDATAVTAVAFCPDGEEVRCRFGAVSGTIAHEPRGDLDFGWGALFVPEPQRQLIDTGQIKTFGEMSPAEKTLFSMRQRAFRSLIDDPFF